ncbi:NADP-dependent oxidoreductase [Parasphingorhabdus halotolerans]|uniref:NADP-dependent oxidoreductase n=1 Tax=Parasphingorhabdus halotolerans TaxID=2725558 RepID=A0A6H2DQB5_9SPHN|nr:NADP-dependent oxidoreductase [Parasphingorhabdus halotolerans]QJB70155.1 NADP-dependent oxidoreductase [Parasphingorhabdus halotolerans]
MTTNRKFTLAKRPDGEPKPDDFKLVEETLPELQDGQFLVRNHYISLDPAQRGWMDDRPSYMPPIPLGDAVRASAMGRVQASKNPDFPEGQWVMGLGAIEEYSVGQSGGFTFPVDVSVAPSPTNFLSVLGAVGMTAYFGLLDDGKPQEGETVLVSGAAGAVGSLVGQIAKIKGCRTVGIAGGADKCARLVSDYGYDAAIDYRGKDVAALEAAVREAAPNGVDIIFENVGGNILDAGLNNLNEKARIIICGLISEYNSKEPVGARNIWQLIVKQATMKGFLVRDYPPRFAEGAAAMGQWVAEGKIKFDEDIDVGIENAYDAFMKLFSGSNQGKMILDVSPAD